MIDISFPEIENFDRLPEVQTQGPTKVDSSVKTRQY